MNALRHVFWAVAMVTTMTCGLGAANQAVPFCSGLQKAEKYLVYGDFARCQAELATLRRTCRDVDCQQRAMLLQRVCEAMAIESMLLKEKDGLTSEQRTAPPPATGEDLTQGANLSIATPPHVNSGPDLQSPPPRNQSGFSGEQRNAFSTVERGSSRQRWSNEIQNYGPPRYEEPPRYSYPPQVSGAWTVPVTPVQFVPVSQAVAPIGQTAQTPQVTPSTQITAPEPSSNSESWGITIFRWSVVLLAICFIVKELRPHLAELAMSKLSPSGKAQFSPSNTGTFLSTDTEPDIFARIVKQNLDLKQAAKTVEVADREDRFPTQVKLHPHLPPGAIRRVA